MAKSKSKSKSSSVKKTGGTFEVTTVITETIIETEVSLADLQQRKVDAVASRGSADTQFQSTLAEHDDVIAKIDQQITDAQAL